MFGQQGRTVGTISTVRTDRADFGAVIVLVRLSWAADTSILLVVKFGRFGPVHVMA